MQNTEIEEVQNKKVRIVLFDSEGKQFNESNIINGRNEYYVMWYDAKMKNYLMFLEYLEKKKFALAKITTILIVDKQE